MTGENVNIKNILIILIVAVVLLTLLVTRGVMRLPTSLDNNHKKSTQKVFVGPNKYQAMFNNSIKSRKSFSDLFGKALDASNSGDQEAAIALLNQCLDYVVMGPDKAMVYEKLFEIYRTKGDLTNELKYLELYPKYTMNEDGKIKARQRASEIRQLLAKKKS